jgi:hypothetical protein
MQGSIDALEPKRRGTWLHRWPHELVSSHAARGAMLGVDIPRCSAIRKASAGMRPGHLDAHPAHPLRPARHRHS